MIIKPVIINTSHMVILFKNKSEIFPLTTLYDINIIVQDCLGWLKFETIYMVYH